MKVCSLSEFTQKTCLTISYFSRDLHEFFKTISTLYPTLEQDNVDHKKGNCSWDMFLWKTSGGLNSFMCFS